MKHRAAIGLLAAVIVLFVGMAAFAILRPVIVLPRMALAPGFTLVDQDGSRLTSEDLRGSIVVYTFAFTGCGEDCPPIPEVMRSLKERLSEIDTGGVPVRLVTLALDDAQHASGVAPDWLLTAARAAGADGDVWRYATAEPSLLKTAVGGGFGVFYDAAAGDGPKLDPTFVLVDGWGITRSRHRSVIPSPDVLAAEIRLLGNEVRASTGIARYAYEAAHLFACYP